MTGDTRTLEYALRRNDALRAMACARESLVLLVRSRPKRQIHLLGGRAGSQARVLITAAGGTRLLKLRYVQASSVRAREAWGDGHLRAVV